MQNVKLFSVAAVATLGWLSYSAVVPTEPYVTEACAEAEFVYEDGSCDNPYAANEARWVYCVLTSEGSDKAVRECDAWFGAYDMGSVANVVEEFARG